MGLTAKATGRGALGSALEIKKRAESDRVIAIAGNPNVGKSTLFNSLTGLNQHTGNWPGKTVTVAQGYCKSRENGYILVDVPGTYSLMAHSAEEEAARNFICFGGADAAVVVCDATCLQRSMNLALQVMEIFPKTLVCVNLMDEARRGGLEIDLDLLEKRLGVPVAGTHARSKRTLGVLTEKLDALCSGRITADPIRLRYTEPIEQAAAEIELVIRELSDGRIDTRWLALRLLEGDKALTEEISRYFGTDLSALPEVEHAVERGREILALAGISSDNLKDRIVSCLLDNAKSVCEGVVSTKKKPSPRKDGSPRSKGMCAADRIFTSRALGYPIMLLMLMAVFWLTIVGANYPSEWLAALLFGLGDRLSELLIYLGAPEWLHGLIADGAFRVLAWVVSVMLPPMAIFFPLFTLLEDSGYLPRVAYNLDKPFSRCKACGKQALSMCMGFGCNAAGIVGCRIIDSKRERLIAMLTNAFVPCNGRFPQPQLVQHLRLTRT